MMKRKSKGLCLILILLLAVGLLGCADKWQTQYDLGVKYLSEGNYEEAVIAFTAAIEIDEKKPEAYISLAEVYQAQEDWENALAALQQGQESCGESEELTAAREELEQILSQQGLVIEENGQIGWAVDPDELMQQLPGELQDYFYLTSAQREERLRPLIPLLQELADTILLDIRPGGLSLLCSQVKPENGLFTRYRRYALRADEQAEGGFVLEEDETFGLENRNYDLGARNAGPVFTWAGQTVRPAQVSTKVDYGVYLQFWTRRGEKETPLCAAMPANVRIEGLDPDSVIGIHTYCRDDAVEIIDARYLTKVPPIPTPKQEDPKQC